MMKSNTSFTIQQITSNLQLSTFSDIWCIHTQSIKQTIYYIILKYFYLIWENIIYLNYQVKSLYYNIQKFCIDPYLLIKKKLM